MLRRGFLQGLGISTAVGISSGAFHALAYNGKEQREELSKLFPDAKPQQIEEAAAKIEKGSSIAAGIIATTAAGCALLARRQLQELKII